MEIHSTPIEQQAIQPHHITQAMDYAAYRAMIAPLLAQEKTTGTNHSPDMVHYTRLNLHRVERLENTSELLPELVTAAQAIHYPMIWLVLVEWWCGDVAQNLPIIAKIAEQNPNIQLKLLLRDEHLDVMDAYLVNGGRSIPVLVCLYAETLEELGRWGPRPAPAQAMLHAYKANPTKSYQEFAEDLHLWYAKDKTATIQQEFIQLLHAWKNILPTQ